MVDPNLTRSPRRSRSRSPRRSRRRSPEPEPQPEQAEPAPTLTPEQAFRESLKQYAYVGSSESDKYHQPTCRWTSKINDGNLVHFDSAEEAQAAGYEPCGTCNPK
ncbi:MAG: Ada metal-binding domain-containing protein [Oscillospiraceae bacterium]